MIFRRKLQHLANAALCLAMLLEEDDAPALRDDAIEMIRRDLLRCVNEVVTEMVPVKDRRQTS